MTQLRKIFKGIHLGYLAITGIIIYLGSYLFALSVFSQLTSEGNVFELFLVSGCIGSLVNFLLYYFFAEQYHYWHIVRSFDEKGKDLFIIELLFLPPVVTFFMSGALAIFVAGVFFEPYGVVWEQSLGMLPSVVDMLVSTMWDNPILLLLLVYLLPTFLLMHSPKILKQTLIKKILIYSAVFVIVPACIYVVGLYIDSHEQVGQLLMRGTTFVVTLLLNFCTNTLDI
jgi:hypothetical protein